MPDLILVNFKAASTISFVAKAETISTSNAVEANICLLAPFITWLVFSFLLAQTAGRIFGDIIFHRVTDFLSLQLNGKVRR
jgi:hypothetical protein